MDDDYRERKRQANARYREKNRDKIRDNHRDMKIALRVETFNVYGTFCAVCGFDDLRALQIDHIDNNGAEERKMLGGQNFSGWRFYYWLKKQGWPEGYQTLCANHNLIKHIESKAL